MTEKKSTSLPVKDIIEWDVRNWGRLINYWTPILDTMPRNSKVLAIGERNGGLSAWLALLGFDVLCTDRESPAEKAKILHNQLGIAHKIKYGELDIVNHTVYSEKFDIIVAKSVIGGLKSDPKNRLTRNFEVQQQAVRNIYSLLNDNGIFLSAENMQGSLLMQWMRSQKGKNKGWRYLKWSELQELFSLFGAVEVKTFGFLPTTFDNDLMNRSCFWMNKHLLAYLPPQYKYISFTMARKLYV